MNAGETTRGYCSGCRTTRRLRFAGWASDGRENGDRPRAFYRACSTCSTRMLVLGDVGDAMSLVREAIYNWRTSSRVEDHTHGDPALRTIDFDDLAGELFATLWALYGTWNPGHGDGRVTFHAYASGLLPRRISSYVRDAVGGEAIYRRNGRGNLTRVWPKAHATSVCVSLDGAAAPAEGEDDDGGDRRGDRLAGSLGASARDFAGDRSPDLGRVLVPRGR